MFRYLRLGLPVVLLAALVGCGPDYSPNTYSTDAVQQANKVDQGTIAGFREVAIRSDGTVGAVAGGAAGGVLGAQTPEGGVVTALSAIGGTLVGGFVGASVERAADDAKGFEYIVRKPNGDLLSVTQKDMTPLAIGLKVLVIEGKQARVVPDYTVPAPTADDTAGKREKNKAETKSGNSSAKNIAPSGPDKADSSVTATEVPSKAAPAQAPQPPAAASSAPAPASSSANDAPAPQAAATPAPQTTPAPAADPQPAQGSQNGSTSSPPASAQAPDGSTPPAAPAQTPAPGDAKP